MELHRLRDRIAAALGLAAFACDPPARQVVVAPVASMPPQTDAAPPRPPGRVLDLPTGAPCDDAIRVQCEKPLAEAPGDHYPSPYASCRVAPNFNAQHTDKRRPTAPDTCCYLECMQMEFEGRPFRAEDTSIRLATSVSRNDWRADWHPDWHAQSAWLDVAPSPELSARWLKAALAEHASIAAFSQISLHLLALGAPPALIEGTHRAALDEIRHATIAFALASAYSDGETFGPSALSIAGLAATRSLREVALDALVDGCVGEATSALAMARDVDDTSELGKVIGNIVSDEESHAALAWRVVRWALSADAGLMPVLAEALERLATGPSLEAQVASEVAIPILRRLVGPVLAHDVRKHDDHRWL